MNDVQKNPLASAPIGKLMVKFAVPSIIAMLVGALYNMVDQLFIGHAVGTLGNAATNVSFPFTTACLALALLFGIGGASCFNLNMGRGNRESAPYYVGTAASMLILCGTAITLIALFFAEPLLRLFGSPEEVLPYALPYVRICAIGFPFMLLSSGGGHLIRADGSPKMTMICNITGALINVVLDALFVLVFHWGMAGAALATIIGQIVSGIIVLWYLRRYRTVKLEKTHFIPRFRYIREIGAIGMASFFNQLAMMVTQIVINNLLQYYGALSVYGESIPIACFGIVMKVNQIFFSVVIGIAQGSQPVESYNYGAENYQRVKDAYRVASIAAGSISLLSFILFQTMPRTLLAMFGNGSAEYFEFGVKAFRVTLFFTFLNFIQPLTSTFFTSIGKAAKGVFLSMTRQILFLIPLALILPRFLGIDGVLRAGPIADLMASVTAILMVVAEFRKMNHLAAEKEKKNA
ncbi:MAG: MATE family efflux transporter [Ruminococcaceae bacterium]|nr:MATE family efflux transporter [Oscillospiraceae bacterium]